MPKKNIPNNVKESKITKKNVPNKGKDSKITKKDEKPLLPPKLNRQRRHSDTVTTVTEGNFLDDPIVQERLRPRNNSVTNALYDR